MLPKIALCDDPLGLRVEGLEPGAECTVRMTAHHGPKCKCGGPWTSNARYIIGDDGVLDPSILPSVGGSYEGLDDHGMLRALGSDKYWPPNWFNVSVEVECGDVRQTFEGFRTTRLPGIEVEELEGPVYGKYYFPKGRTNLPSVVVIPGTGGDGSASTNTAAFIASHGFAALALQIWSKKKTPALPRRYRRIPVEYIVRAVDWIAAREETIDRVGIVAISGGVPGACLAASTTDRVTAVAGLSGPTLLFGRSRSGSARSPWMIGGRSLRGLRPGIRTLFARWESDPTQAAMVAAVLRQVKATVPLLPLGNVAAPILVALGEDDELIPPEAIADPVVARARADDVVLRYPGAGHLGELPGTRSAPWKMKRAAGLITTSNGGTDQANAFAYRDSWRHIVEFFRRHVGPAEEVPREQTPTLSGPLEEREDDVSGRGSTEEPR